MTYVQSFTGVTPPARFDEVPWATAIVKEAGAIDGVYLTVEAVSLPSEESPASPGAVDITTTLATFPDGYYRFQFADADGVLSPDTAPVLAPGDVSWRPSTANVATLLVERTGRAIDDDVATVDGDFTARTNPTRAQVEKFIDLAVEDVVARVQVAIVPGQITQARNVAAYWASVLAELSRVPGGAADDGVSVAPQYQGAYLARLEELKDACQTWNARLV